MQIPTSEVGPESLHSSEAPGGADPMGLPAALGFARLELPRRDSHVYVLTPAFSVWGSVLEWFRNLGIG